MIVTRKNGQKTLGLDQGFHKGLVGAIVVTVIAGTITDITLLPNQFFVNARLCCFGAAAMFLKIESCMYWDMHKGQAWDGMTVLFTKFAVLLDEPCNNLLNLVSVRIVL